MKDLIKIVNELFQIHLLSEKKEKNLYQLYFSKKNKLFFLKNERNLLEEYLQIEICNEIEKTNFYTRKLFSYISTLNGIIILDIKNSEIIKILDKKYEPNFLNNELSASNLYYKNYPEIINHSLIEEYQNIKYKFIKTDKILSWTNWEKKLKILFDILFSKKRELIKEENKIYLLKMQKNLMNYNNHLYFFRKEFNRISPKLNLLLNTYSENTNKYTYKLFSHGDITPNNIIQNNNTFYIFDWANGGIHTFIYDLMLQNLYFKDFVIWKEFSSINFLENEDKEIFFGITKFYIQKVESLYNIKFSENDIKQSIVYSLVEVFLKNLYRYQRKKYCNEGKLMLEHIEFIIDNILDSKVSSNV